MTSEPRNASRRVLSGAAIGAAGWTAYAAVEALLASILPWLIHPHSSYFPVHPGTSAILFAFYLLIGIAVGCILSAFEVNVQAGVTLSILIAVYAHLFRHLSGWSLVAASLIAVSLVVLIRHVGPWTASALLLGPVWIARDAFVDSPFRVKAAIAIGWIVVIVVLSRLVRPVKRPAANLAIAVLVLIATFPLRQPAPTLRVSSSPSAQPNVILITLDTVRADHLSLYGYSRDTTPFLTRFASRSTLFKTPIAASNMTPATHAALMTGRWASANGDYNENGVTAPPLVETTPTLSTLLRRRGYATAAIVSNFAFLGPEFGLTRGFEYVDSRAAVTLLAEPPEFFLRYTVCRLLRSRRFTPDAENRSREAATINREALDVIRKLSRQHAPFFLFLNYMDAHYPYVARRPFNDRFPGSASGPWSADLVQDLYSRLRDATMHRRPVDSAVRPEERAELIARYDASIAYLDAQLGRLIADLQNAGVYDNTLLIITSDHGEAFGDRGYLGHGTSAYQDQTFVPLLIKLPRQNRGAVVTEPVSTVDVFPTIAEVVGVPMPFRGDGVGLVHPSTPREQPVITEAFPLSANAASPVPLWTGRAIVDGTSKLLVPSAGLVEMYDLEADPDERHDLSATTPTVAEELKQRLQRTLPTLPPHNRPPNAEALRKLRALGYVH
jgi:arylsulfatase A-like enzyme